MEKTKDDKVTSDEYFNIWSECHQILNRRIRDDEFDLQNAQDRKSKLVCCHKLRKIKSKFCNKTEVHSNLH
jgi:hypothetical protein